MIYTDFYYEIGQTHSKCDDYALAESNGDTAYAIVSDGCTGSTSRNTDLGARLLTLMSRNILINLTKTGKYFQDIGKVKTDINIFKEIMLHKTSEITTLMNLDTHAFEATLLVALSIMDYKLLFAYGDGTFIVKYADGKILLLNIEFEPNIPCYLIYSINSSAQDLYDKEMSSGKMVITETLIDNDTVTHRKKIVSGSWIFAYDPSRWGSISQMIVCSDGVSSFQHDPKSEQFQTNNKTFCVEDIYKDITDFKDLNGCFVERRLRRLSITNAKKRIIHTDDLGVAAIAYEAESRKYDSN